MGSFLDEFVDLREISIAFVKIEPVPDDKSVLDLGAEKGDIDLDLSSRRF